MTISLIAAMAKNRVIGFQNQMPWHLPADLKHFKQLTLHKPIIMGRNTFESIKTPLPERENIIVTTNPTYHAKDCVIVHSIADALTHTTSANEVMIIGGAALFQQTLSLADKMYLTFIDLDCVGDTFFPVWNETEWRMTESQAFSADEKNKYDYRFVTYER